MVGSGRVGSGRVGSDETGTVIIELTQLNYKLTRKLKLSLAIIRLLKIGGANS